MAKAAEVIIQPSELSLNATMVRSCLAAGVTAAKLNDVSLAFGYLADAKGYIKAIESMLADNPAKG